jgi:hypothetical protein
MFDRSETGIAHLLHEGPTCPSEVAAKLGEIGDDGMDAIRIAPSFD